MVIKQANTYFLPRRRQLSGGLVLEYPVRESFLETLVVVAIIAILVGLGSSAYRVAVDKAMLVEVASVAQTYRAYAAEYYAVTGRLPEEIETSDGSPNFASRYFESIDWLDDEIVFDIRSEFSERFSSGRDPVATDTGVVTLSFRVARAAETGRQVFLCGYAEPPDGFVAEVMRHTSISESLLPSFCRT